MMVAEYYLRTMRLTLASQTRSTFIYDTLVLTHLTQTNPYLPLMIQDELIIRLLCTMRTRYSRIFRVRIARAASVMNALKHICMHRVCVYTPVCCIVKVRSDGYAGK